MSVLLLRGQAGIGAAGSPTSIPLPPTVAWGPLFLEPTQLSFFPDRVTGSFSLTRSFFNVWKRSRRERTRLYIDYYTGFKRVPITSHFSGCWWGCPAATRQIPFHTLAGSRVLPHISRLKAGFFLPSTKQGSAAPGPRHNAPTLPQERPPPWMSGSFLRRPCSRIQPWLSPLRLPAQSQQGGGGLPAF